jgi:hypothetical protein
MTSKKPKQADDEEERIDSNEESGDETDSSEDNVDSVLKEVKIIKNRNHNPK